MHENIKIICTFVIKIRNYKMSNQLKLNFSNLDPRKFTLESEFEATHGDLLNEFDKLVTQAFKEAKYFLKDIPLHCRGRNLKAELLNGLVCGKILEKFPDKAIFSKYKRIGYQASGILTHFKKLNNKLRPNHNETNNSFLLESNQQLKNENEGSIVWLGYTVKRDWSCILKTYAICLGQAKNIKWIIDLKERNIMKNNISLVKPITESEPVLKTNISKKKRVI